MTDTDTLFRKQHIGTQVSPLAVGVSQSARLSLKMRAPLERRSGKLQPASGESGCQRP